MADRSHHCPARRRPGPAAALGVALLIVLGACSDATPASDGSRPASRATESRDDGPGSVDSTGTAASDRAPRHEGEPDRAAPSDRSPRSARVSHPTVVARGLDSPWGLAFLPNGAILVGERDTARIRLVRPGHGSRVVAHLRGVHSDRAEGGETGLLGLALAPHFRTNHWVYVYFSGAHDNRIARMRWRDHRLGPQRVVFSGIPKGLHHNGGRIAFGPDGMLYVTTGEGGVPTRAQHRRSLGGKILRMTPRGRPAPGNPFRASVVYSYGHRNVEGLDWDPRGRLWATEFGDHSWDEVNLIRAGRNYGWPIVEGPAPGRRFTDPKLAWRTSSAGPSGIAIVRSRAGTFGFVGGLTGERLWRVRIEGSRIVHRSALYRGRWGRIRTTAAAQGRLWITTSNTDGRATPRRGDDKLIRLRLG